MTSKGSHDDETSGRGGDVLELLNRPAWHAQALCKSTPDVSWFPEFSSQLKTAIRVCNECPVMLECRDWALEQNAWTLYGVWGGMGQPARIAAAKKAGHTPGVGLAQ